MDPDTDGRCASCGADDDDTAPVHRVYLSLRDGRVVGDDVQPEVERWCRACRATYPHRPA